MGTINPEAPVASRHDADLKVATQICASDRATEEAFVRAHISWMRNLARRFFPDQASADDVVQDAFASAFKAIGRYEGRSSLRTWLHRITVNAALMKIRKIKRLDECAINELMPEYDSEGFRVEAPWSQIATPEEILHHNEMRDIVIDAIARLPDNYRIVLQMRDIEELDTAEVARQLELSESNVKVRLHRARAALKTLLEPVLRGKTNE